METKKYVRKVIKDVSDNVLADMGHKFRAPRVPHVTFVRSFDTTNERRLLSAMGNVVKRYDLPEFRLVGFGKFDHGNKKKRVAFIDIKPSKDLEQMRVELSQYPQAFLSS